MAKNLATETKRGAAMSRPLYRDARDCQSDRQAVRTGRLLNGSLASAVDDDRLAIAVALVGLLGGARVDRTFLAVGQGGDAAGRHAAGDQVFADGIGPAGAEGQVVFAGAAFVAVAFDPDPDIGPATQPGDWASSTGAASARTTYWSRSK